MTIKKIKMCDFGEIKNLACASREEQKRFFCSFDHVLSDMDGKKIKFFYNTGISIKILLPQCPTPV